LCLTNLSMIDCWFLMHPITIALTNNEGVFMNKVFITITIAIQIVTLAYVTQIDRKLHDVTTWNVLDERLK